MLNKSFIALLDEYGYLDIGINAKSRYMKGSETRYRSLINEILGQNSKYRQIDEYDN